MTLPLGKLSPTPLPFASDVSHGTVLYYTDSESVGQLTGPWAPNTPYDAYVNGLTPVLGPFGSSAVIGGRRTNGGAVAGFAPGSLDYVGAINTDADGKINTHEDYRPNPRWDIWNFFNQSDITILGGGNATVAVTTPAGTQNVPAWFHLAPELTAKAFTGLPTDIDITFDQAINGLAGPAGGSAWADTAIGLGNVTPLGFWGEIGHDNGFSGTGNGPGVGMSSDTRYTLRRLVGAQDIWGLGWARVIANASDVATATFFANNHEFNSVLRVKWRG